MNGARSTYMRKGYLLTALAAAVLLAASPGTASAQSIGFTASSGSVAEAASLEGGALEGPLRITIKASGLPANPTTRAAILEAVVLTVNGAIRYDKISAATGRPAGSDTDAAGTLAAAADIPIGSADFNANNEASLVVVQGEDGTTDGNWLSEMMRFTLTAGAGTSISPNVFMLTVNDSDVAPVARFTAPSFTLTEGSERDVSVDIVSGTTGRDTGLPAAAIASTGNNGNIVLSVSNHRMVTIGDANSNCAPTAASGTNLLGQTRKPIHLALGALWGTPEATDAAAFGRTARLATDATAGTIEAIAAAGAAASMTIKSCNVSGFRNQAATLTILPSNLVEPASARVRGDISIGSPLMVTVDSDEMAPTLSFSPTDVTIDEGGSISTRLISDGTNATEVGLVKLMVEGDAMVDLYHEDTLLEEMNGYVMVDMGMSNSVRLTAMSTSDPDLMDGDMAYKAWKLTDGSSDAMVGDDYWFRVDVRGSTAVPALPLVGQLLLALFLMAGGSRLYRRRQG